MKPASVDYTTFKSLVSAKNLLIQYIEYSSSYEIFATEDSAVCWQTAINKDGGADQTDFETNYKPTANAALLGQKTASKSLPVVLAIDQSSIPVTTAVELISTTRNPAVPVGTRVIFQTGVFGTPLGLLAAITNTPQFIEMIMTTNGLKPITCC